MKRLSSYVVEGLRQQGPHCVWITLGHHPSEADAQMHAAMSSPECVDIIETRVVALFRDTPEVTTPRPHVQPSRRRSAALRDNSSASTLA